MLDSQWVRWFCQYKPFIKSSWIFLGCYTKCIFTPQHQTIFSNEKPFTGLLMLQKWENPKVKLMNFMVLCEYFYPIIKILCVLPQSMFTCNLDQILRCLIFGGQVVRAKKKPPLINLSLYYSTLSAANPYFSTLRAFLLLWFGITRSNIVDIEVILLWTCLIYKQHLINQATHNNIWKIAMFSLLHGWE